MPTTSELQRAYDDASDAVVVNQINTERLMAARDNAWQELNEQLSRDQAVIAAQAKVDEATHLLDDANEAYIAAVREQASQALAAPMSLAEAMGEPLGDTETVDV